MELGIEALLFAHADARNKMALLLYRDKRMPGNPRAALHPLQRLRAPIVLTDPTKSEASCFTMWAKLPQHEYKGCVVLLGMRSRSTLASPKSATPFPLITAL